MTNAEPPDPAEPAEPSGRPSAPGAGAEPDAGAAGASRPAPALTGAQRRFLRGRANPLKPLVHVGASGLTEGVVAATERALLDHELVKVRLHQPEDKHAAADELAARTGAALAGVIGHTVILYRPHPEKPRLQLP